MPACELHMVDKCPICKPHMQPAAAGLLIGGPLPQVMTGQPLGESVRIPNEVTDPAAKNVLQLAQDYAEAQDNLAAIRAAVVNTRSLLKGLERELLAAEKKCTTAQESLHYAVAPTTPKVARVRKPKPVLDVAEKEYEAAK